VERRDFIKIFSVATVAAWPAVAGAQEFKGSSIGFLSSRSAGESAQVLASFRKGLREVGYIEGQNVALVFRWADGQYERLPGLAAELVNRPVTVIAATGGDPSALAAKAQTKTIPIVFTTGSDPVKTGLVRNFNQPEANVTGVSFQVNELGAKRLELLREIVPAAEVIGFLVNQSNPSTEAEVKSVQAAARDIGQQLHIMHAGRESDFDGVFEELVQRKVKALLVGNDPFFNSRRSELTALSERHSIPTVYYAREYVAAGGLVSYGASIIDAYRQAGVYVGRILQGAKPGELPVQQPTKFELAINMKTAKSLGLTIPGMVLMRADDLIE
jgi:putative ABC transport system substrate-binding protein